MKKKILKYALGATLALSTVSMGCFTAHASDVQGTADVEAIVDEVVDAESADDENEEVVETESNEYESDAVMADQELETENVDTTEIEENAKGVWVKQQNDWYYYEDGQLVEETFKDIDGKKYLFGYEGRLVTDFFGNAGWDLGSPYMIIVYIDKNGVVATNKWVETEIGNWNYFGADGKALEGWQVINGKTYYFSHRYGEDIGYYEGGGMVVGDTIINGKKYHFAANGAWDGKEGIALNSWYKVNGYWHYCKADGHDAEHELVTIGNDTYYFDGNGIMARLKIVDGRAYGANGKMVKSGWFKNGYGEYAYVENGKVVTGLQIIGGKTYYFEESRWKQEGYLRYDPGVIVDQGKRYYEINSSGEVVKIHIASGTKWIKLSNGKYIYSKNGEFLSDCSEKIDGVVYSFNEDGVMNASCLEPGKGYFGASGALKTTNGWVSVKAANGDKVWYYLTNGYYAQGANTIKGVDYYFGISGELTSGVAKVDGVYYYYFGGDDGRAKLNFKEGWNLYNDKWYYMRNGELVQGSLKWKNNWYYFGSDYSMLCDTGAQVENQLYYYRFYIYLDADGKAVKNKWEKWDGVWYYFDANGRCVTGEQVIGGKTYIFDERGRWIK